MRVSNPRAIAYFHFNMPFESSNIPGTLPVFQIELWKTGRTLRFQHNICVFPDPDLGNIPTTARKQPRSTQTRERPIVVSEIMGLFRPPRRVNTRRITRRRRRSVSSPCTAHAWHLLEGTRRATSVNTQLLHLQKDPHTGSISRDVNFSPELCRCRSCVFTEVARLVPPESYLIPSHAISSHMISSHLISKSCLACFVLSCGMSLPHTCC